MKTIEELLKNLARPEVLEFGLVTNRLPSVNIGGKFEPVDDEAPSTERLMQMLVTMGGSRYVDSLSDKPVQWTTRLDGVGVIAVAAIMRKEIVQARFTVAKREGAGASTAAMRSPVATTQQSAGGQRSADKAQQAAAAAATSAQTQASPAAAQQTPQRPAAALGRTQESRTDKAVPAPTPSPQPVGTKPASSAQQPVAQPASTQARAAQPTSSSGPAATPASTATSGASSASAIQAAKPQGQIQPQVIKSVTAGAASPGGSTPNPPPAASAAATAASTPAAPVSATQVAPQPQPRPAAGQPPGATGSVGAQPAAVPAPPSSEDEWDDDDEPTLQTLSPPVSPPGAGASAEPRPKPARRPEEVSRPDAEEANTRAATEARAAQERAAQERATAERAAAEQRAAQERAAAERAAQERAAAERAAQERAAQERAAAERAAQERAAAERAAAERAAAERAAQERAAAERAAAERAAAERAAAERAAAERVAQERAAAERAAQERAAQERATQERVQREREARAAQERAARERAAAQDAQRAKAAAQMGGSASNRRINTPTSVDAVDVEITTTDAGSGKKPVTIDIDLDADGSENTVSVPGEEGKSTAVAKAGAATAAGAATSASPAAKQDTRASATQAAAQPASASAQPAAAAASATVSTGTAPTIAEKDRPRVEATAAVDAFLAMALAARASDLHIIASRPVLLRVATDLLPRTQPVPPEHVERIAKEIVPARLREVLDRDGSCDFAVEHTTHGRFRVNVSRQRTGFKINLRVIPKEIQSFQALGLPDTLVNSLRFTRGLVLITGPSSHGKSTTLTAMIDWLNRETARHIITIEEPIEQVHTRKKGLVSQREVGLHTRARGRAIQSALREDMDALVVSELRDRESVRLALTACESGRLVLGTMNMPSAAKTIDRIFDMFPPHEESWVRSSLASSLRLIVGQRLIPSADRTRLHAAVELLPWSVALYGIIRDGRTHQLAALQQRGKPLGIVRLDESLAELVKAQKVTIEVAKQFAESPADLESQTSAPLTTATRASLTATPQARKG